MPIIVETEQLKFEFHSLQGLKNAIEDAKCDGIGERVG